MNSQMTNNQKILAKHREQITLNILTEFNLTQLNNILQAREKAVHLLTRTSTDTLYNLDLKWQMKFHQALKKLINTLDFDALDIMTTNDEINFYFKSWDKSEKIFEDQSFINLLNFLEVYEKSHVKIKTKCIENSNTILNIGFKFE